VKECGGGAQYKCNARIKKNHLQKSFLKKHLFPKRYISWRLTHRFTTYPKWPSDNDFFEGEFLTH
jgi:hypothetical protein